MKNINSEQRTLYCYLNTDNPLVAWSCARGVLNPVRPEEQSGEISLFLYQRIASLPQSETQKNLEGSRKRVFFEGIIEDIRRKFFPNMISRLTGMYFFDNKDDAELAAVDWGIKYFTSDNLVEVSFFPNLLPTKVDSNWITFKWIDLNEHAVTFQEFCQQMLNDTDWIHKYWNGETHPDFTPLWELIVNQPGLIRGNSTLKKSCYDYFLREHCYFIWALEACTFAVGNDNRSKVGECKIFAIEKNSFLTIAPYIYLPDDEIAQACELTMNQNKFSTIARSMLPFDGNQFQIFDLRPLILNVSIEELSKNGIHFIKPPASLLSKIAQKVKFSIYKCLKTIFVSH